MASFFTAIEDRLNPILVREVRQAVNGKLLVVTGGLALFGIVLIALVAASGGNTVGRGAQVFVTALQVLAPVVLFIVPLQAFLSTRHEVMKGTIEHLLLSHLTPGQIVRGKLAAAVVQFVLYLAIFAPLIAMTFLLRGVDVPTIAYAIMLAFLFGIGSSALAVACGAVSRWRALFRVLPFAVVILGLGSFTITIMAGLSEFLFELTREAMTGQFWEITTAIVVPVIGATVLCALVGTAALSHPYENRSTGFRVFSLVALVGAFVWMGIAMPATRTAIPGYVRSARLAWEMSAGLAGFLCLFPLFAVTEPQRLNARMRMHVAKNPLLAVLSTPLLPGSGRGVLYTLLFAGLGLVLPPVLASVAGYTDPGETDIGFGVMAWSYVVIYASLSAFVRRRLPPTPKATWIARAVPVGVLLLSVLLPLLVEVVAQSGRIGRWAWYRILDPFTTFDHFDGTPSPWNVMPGLAFLVLLGLALNVVAMASGLGEVWKASKARRRRAG